MSDMKIGLCSMDGPGGPLPRANHPPGVADTTPDLKGQGLRREERVQLGSLSVDFLCRNKGPQSHPASSSIIQHLNIDLMAHGWPIFFAVPLPFLDAAIHEKHR